jgi:hypothetical protein
MPRNLFAYENENASRFHTGSEGVLTMRNLHKVLRLLLNERYLPFHASTCIFLPYFASIASSALAVSFSARISSR